MKIDRVLEALNKALEEKDVEIWCKTEKIKELEKEIERLKKLKDW
jgi:hypothetical protein